MIFEIDKRTVFVIRGTQFTVPYIFSLNMPAGGGQQKGHDSGSVL